MTPEQFVAAHVEFVRKHRAHLDACDRYDTARAEKDKAAEDLYVAEQAWRQVEHEHAADVNRADLALAALEATPPDFARRDAAALVNAALLADAGTPKDAS